MVERFVTALKEAIFAIDRPQMDIAARCGVSRTLIYRLTSINGAENKPLKKNAEVLTNYLCAELDDKLRYHIKEVKRLREIKNTMSESYDALYPEKKKKKRSEDEYEE